MTDPRGFYDTDGHPLVTASTVAEALHISLAALRTKRHRHPGWLPVAARGPHGETLFRHADIHKRLITETDGVTSDVA